MGTVIKSLKSRGVWDNTIFAFTSDNGAPEHRGDNYPLRGGKRTNYEGGLRTPTIFSFPKRLSKFRGRQESSILKITDLTATFLLAACRNDCAGIFEPDADGVDISAVIEDRLTVPGFRVLHLDDRSAAFVYGSFKAIQNPMRINTPDASKFDVEVYDIHSDPEERFNLSGQMPDLAARFRTDIIRLREEMPPAREWMPANGGKYFDGPRFQRTTGLLVIFTGRIMPYLHYSNTIQ